MSTFLVCGSRDWTDAPTIVAWLSRLQETVDVVIVHGACRGADQMAANCAKYFGYEVRAYPADWSRGPKAGPERNQRMLDDSRPRRVLAFGIVDDAGNLSRGTADMVRRALKAGVPVTIVTPGARL